MTLPSAYPGSTGPWVVITPEESGDLSYERFDSYGEAKTYADSAFLKCAIVRCDWIEDIS